MIRSIVLGTGSYLPEKVITNDDMARMVDTSHDWIVQRTGIHKRHFADSSQMTSDLGTEAARRALDAAGLAPDDIDLIVLATATPDETFPATATQVQRKLGMTRGFGFDVNGVCCGFLTALSTADCMLQTGNAKTALVIGAEIFSRIIDMTDRRTCVLFGDGAGAMVLRAEEQPGTPEDSGIFGVDLQSDGCLREILYTDGGVAKTGTAGYIRMAGQEVFKHAVVKLAQTASDTLQKYGLEGDQVDWMIPHQANGRIIEGMAKKLKVPLEKVICTVQEHANTSAASIPLAVDWAVQNGKLKKGDLVLHDALGGGLVWGSALIRY